MRNIRWHASDRITLYQAVITTMKALFSDLQNAEEEKHEVTEPARKGEVRV